MRMSLPKPPMAFSIIVPGDQEGSRYRLTFEKVSRIEVQALAVIDVGVIERLGISSAIKR